MSGIWKKRFTHVFKGFAKNKEVAKINKAVIETETKFVLGVNGEGMEEC